jgi:hypothetical protein
MLEIHCNKECILFRGHRHHSCFFHPHSHGTFTFFFLEFAAEVVESMVKEKKEKKEKDEEKAKNKCVLFILIIIVFKQL